MSLSFKSWKTKITNTSRYSILTKNKRFLNKGTLNFFIKGRKFLNKEKFKKDSLFIDLYSFNIFFKSTFKFGDYLDVYKNLEYLKKKKIKYKKFNLDVFIGESYKKKFFFYKIIKFSIKDLIYNNFFLGNFLKKSFFFYNNFFLGFRSKFLVFNLEFTVFLLRKSLNFVIDSFFCLSSENVSLMYTSNEGLSDFLKKIFFRKGQSFFCGSWVNGFLTNFKTAKSNINRLRKNFFNLKYHKDKLLFKKLKGIHIFMVFPFFLLNSEFNQNIFLEIKKMEVPSICLIDSNNRCDYISYVIPCNTNSFLTKKIFFYLYQRCIFFYKFFCFIKLFNSDLLKFSKLFNVNVFSKNVKKKEKLIFDLYKIKRDLMLKKKNFSLLDNKNFF